MTYNTLQSLKYTKIPEPVVEVPVVEYSIYTVTYIDGTTTEIGIPLSETSSFDTYIANNVFSGDLTEYAEFNFIEL